MTVTAPPTTGGRVVERGTLAGIEWAVLRPDDKPTMNGYIHLPDKHPWMSFDTDDLERAFHYRVTMTLRDGQWRGFDTAANDGPPDEIIQLIKAFGLTDIAESLLPTPTQRRPWSREKAVRAAREWAMHAVVAQHNDNLMVKHGTPGNLGHVDFDTDAIERGTHEGVEWVITPAPRWGALNGYLRIPDGPIRDLGLGGPVTMARAFKGLITYFDSDLWVGFTTVDGDDYWPARPAYFDSMGLYGVGDLDKDDAEWNHDRVRGAIEMVANAVASANKDMRKEQRKDKRR